MDELLRIVFLEADNKSKQKKRSEGREMVDDDDIEDEVVDVCNCGDDDCDNK
jgi:hypothetical protein